MLEYGGTSLQDVVAQDVAGVEDFSAVGEGRGGVCTISLSPQFYKEKHHVSLFTLVLRDAKVNGFV